MIGTLKTVVLDAADIRELASFYSRLAGLTEHSVDDDWITLTTDGWRIAFQLAPDHRAPRWPDRAYPQQAHLDFMTLDIDAATARAESMGARRLGGGDTWHVLADPAGHPFCLCQGEEPGVSVFGVTIDCPDAKALSHFYADLLGMEMLYDGDEGCMIGTGGTGKLMFQQVADYQPPRWPDPAHPQQYHLDVQVTDVEEAEPKALTLGATKLAEGDGEWRVYADPAGHPFCLVW